MKVVRYKSSSKKKNPISLKKKTKGSFTAYCKRHGFKGVTTACIRKGLKSKNPLTRKRANFAKVSRTWKKR